MITLELVAVGDFYRRDFQQFRAGYFQCRNCHEPHSAALASNPLVHPQGDLDDPAYPDQNIDSLGWYVYESWPARDDSGLSADVPERIRDIFRQAESNFAAEGNEESAAIMYRKAMEVALGDLNVEGRTLYDRINALVKQNRLGPEIAEWAHEVRLIGNTAAHESKPPERSDVIDLRGLTEILLRLLYVIPALIARRRSRAEEIRTEEKQP